MPRPDSRRNDMKARLFSPLFSWVLAALIALVFPLAALADPAASAAQARLWRQAHEQEIVDGFSELLRLPNVASDAANIRRNANYIQDLT